MKKICFLLLLVLLPLFASAESGYVGDWIDLEIDYKSNELLGDATWDIMSGPSICVDFPARTGTKTSIKIVSYFTETLKLRVKYQLKNGQNKFEYFNITCNSVTLNVTPSSINLDIGGKEYIRYTSSPSGKYPQVGYKSTNNNVVTVNSTGEVLAKGEGSAKIKVSNNMGPEVEIPVTVGNGGNNGGDNNGGGDNGGGDNGGGDNGGGGWSSDDDEIFAQSKEGVTLKFYKFSTYWGDEIGVSRDCILSGTNTVKGRITIPDHVKGYPVTTISSGAFYGQDGLTELVLPSTITKVYDYAIYTSCKNLRTIICEAISIPAVGYEGIITTLCKNIVLYVPKGTKKIYQQCRGWEDFGSIKEIGDEETNIQINSTNFPDDNFRKYLLGKDYGADGILTELEIKNITFMQCIAEGIGSLKGIEFFTSLEELYCSWNSVKSLDLSHNTKLKKLECAHCGLTTLDLSQNTALVFLDCSLNMIEGLGMDNLVNNLPTTVNGVFHVTRGDNNICTKTQVAIAKAKGWTTYSYEGTNGWEEIWVVYGGIEQNIVINATNFPDDNFRKYLLEQDYGKDGVITEDELKTIRYISVDSYPGGIVSLQGIEFFTALEHLVCTYNKLASLDLSKNTALTWLDCYENQLTSLDVSKCTALTWLGCQTNQLASLDISNNTALTNLNCNYNQLTSLDVSKNTALTYLVCADNQLTSLDVSKNISLTNLYCPYNQLISLDVSKNTALISLHCERNELTNLDVSNNTDLQTLYVDRNHIWGDRMDALIASLPQARYNDNVFNVVYNPEFDANVCTTIQVEEAKAKSWNPTYWNGTPYSGSDPSAIKGILMDRSSNTPIYNLNGQRMDKLRKGVNIIRGKKVVIR